MAGAFGKIVNNILKKRGISQSELASLMGVTRQNVSAMLRQEKPHQRTLERFAEAMGLDPEKFVGTVKLHQAQKDMMDFIDTGVAAQKIKIKAYNPGSNSNYVVGIGQSSSEIKNDTHFLDHEGKLIKNSLIESQATEFKRINSDQIVIVTPLVSQITYESYLRNFSNIQYLKNLPKHMVTSNNNETGVWRSFEVYGDTFYDFNSTSLFMGDIVSCEKLEKLTPESLKLATGRNCVIITEERIIVSKIILFDGLTEQITIQDLAFGGMKSEIVLTTSIFELFIVKVVTRVLN